jgi:hypothetical protein
MITLKYKQISIENLKVGQELFYLTEHSKYIHRAHVIEIRKVNTLEKVHKEDNNPEYFKKATKVTTLYVDDIQFHDIEIHHCYVSGNVDAFTRVLPDGYFLTEKDIRNFISKTEVKKFEIIKKK